MRESGEHMTHMLQSGIEGVGSRIRSWWDLGSLPRDLESLAAESRGGLPYKNDGGARRTFLGLKMRFWYL